MKKEVPPFGVLSADYSPDTHVIIRSQDKAPGRLTDMPRGKTVASQKGQSPLTQNEEEYRATSFAKSNEEHQKSSLAVTQEQQNINMAVHS